MSKQIKQMEMDALKNTFREVRDMVMLSVTGLGSQADNQLRLTLRKKNIRLQVVKNSLTRRVFDELGIKIGGDSPVWAGPTVVAWGGTSIKELSLELENQVGELVKKNAKLKDRFKFKGSVADGLPIPFEVGRTLPTRAEVIGGIIGALLAPISQLLGQITGPGSEVASQIKTLAEKEASTEATATGQAG